MTIQEQLRAFCQVLDAASNAADRVRVAEEVEVEPAERSAAWAALQTQLSLLTAGIAAIEPLVAAHEPPR
jgi:hypothetical protein